LFFACYLYSQHLFLKTNSSMSGLICFLNGRFIPLAEATIPVNDLGLQRGYGIFDFLRITDGVPLFLEDHLDRFYQSADKMRLSIPLNRDE
jgi:branched-chain amino acid aminotransferase